MFWYLVPVFFAVLSGSIYCFNHFGLAIHKNALLVTHPFTGPFRSFFEWAGHYTREHLQKDWEERPFNRLTRQWIYRSAKGISNYISFGSEIDAEEPGTIIFVNSTFPIQEEDAQKFPGKWIGDGHCGQPYFAESFFNLTGMSYGALGATSIEALSAGSALANIWMNTGEGGFSVYHRHATDIVFQI